MKRFKLENIRKYRKIRDESFICENNGRLKKLIWEFNNICRIDTNQGGWRDEYIEIELDNGYSFKEYNTFLYKAIKQMILFLYRKWRKEYLTLNHNRR